MKFSPRSCLIAPTWCVIMLLLFCVFPQAVEASSLQAVTWAGSEGNRSLLNPNYAQALQALNANGITYAGTQNITASVLANTCIMFMNEIPSAPTQQEMDLLGAWVLAGGRLVINVDSGGAPKQPSNDMLAYMLPALGATGMSFTGFSPGTGTFQAGQFSAGIQGMALNASPGSGVTGGTAIIANSIHYQGVGAGFFILAGDSWQHNAVWGSVAAQLQNNLCSNCTAPNAVPEVSPGVYAALGLGLIAIFRLRKEKALT